MIQAKVSSCEVVDYIEESGAASLAAVEDHLSVISGLRRCR